MQYLFVWLKVSCFPPNVDDPKKRLAYVMWHWWLWRKTACDVWQLKCQASNITASVQSDHLLHGAGFLSFSPLISCIIQHMLLHHAPDSVIYRIWIRTIGWPHVRTDEMECLTVQKLDSVVSMICWCIVLLEDTHLQFTQMKKKFCISQGSAVTFSDWWASSQSWLQFVLFWHNANNWKYVIVALLKDRFFGSQCSCTITSGFGCRNVSGGCTHC